MPLFNRDQGLATAYQAIQDAQNGHTHAAAGLDQALLQLTNLYLGTHAETYETISYSGVNGGVPITGSFVEQIDGTTWIENNTFHFTELSETSSGVTLYDASRGVTVTADYATHDLNVAFGSTSLDWTITGVTHGLLW